MANEYGKWETVINSKKRSQVSRNDVRKAKERFLDNPSHVKADIKNPLEGGETIYSAAFDNKENKTPEDKYPSFHQVGDPNKKGNAPNASPGKSIQRHKKNQKPTKPPPLDGVEEKIKQLSGENLSSIIKGVQDRFPTHSLIWLKEVAYWLQNELAGPVEKDLMLLSKPRGFPGTSLTSNIRDQLKKVLKESSDQSIEMLFCFCITSMLEHIKQGKSTIGFRLLVQLIIEHMPKVLLNKIEEVLHGKAISQDSFLVVIWAYSQKFDDLDSGIKAWWKIMYPVLRVGTHAPHVVSYLEELIERYQGARFNKQFIDGKQFTDVLNIIFSTKTQLANLPSLKQRFEKLYPALKRMYFGDKSENVSSLKFKALLDLVATSDEVLQNELLRLLVYCLSEDPKCCSSWLDSVEKTLKPSSILWSHIYQNFVTVNKEILGKKKYKNRNLIQHQANEFLLKLQEIKRKGNGSKAGFQECFEVCQKFQARNPAGGKKKLTMMNLLKYLCIGLLTLLAVDIYRSKGYRGSKTQSYATNLGIDNHVSAVFLQLESIAGTAGRWSKENISPHYAKVHYYLEPALETSWNYTIFVYNKAYEFTKPGLEYTSGTVQKIFVKVDEILPGYMDKVAENTKYLWNSIFPTAQHYLNSTINLVSEKVPIGITYLSNVTKATSVWIYKLHPPFFDSAMMHASCAMSCVRRYANGFWDILVQYTPVVMDMSVEYFRWMTEVMQKYLTAGQSWVQNAMRSVNIGGNSGATTK